MNLADQQMDVPDLKNEIEEKSKGARTEQRIKLRQLQERRIQLQHAHAAEGFANEKERKKHKKRKLPAPTLKGGIPRAQPGDKLKIPVGDMRSGKDPRHVFQVAGKADSSGIDGATTQTRAGPESSESEALHPNREQILRAVDNYSRDPSISTKKKRNKLHWGLEIKQRWERKGNM